MKIIQTRPFPSDYLTPGHMKCQKEAKFQNKGVKNTKLLILGEIIQFVYSNFLKMLYTLVDKDNNTN